jgi:hypothetical protein
LAKILITVNTAVKLNATNFNEQYTCLTTARRGKSAYYYYYYYYYYNTVSSLMDKGGEEILQGLKTNAEC